MKRNNICYYSKPIVKAYIYIYNMLYLSKIRILTYYLILLASKIFIIQQTTLLDYYNNTKKSITCLT